MKINTVLAIALLITGSSLYAEETFMGHGPVRDRQERREQRREDREKRREERRNEREDRRSSRDYEYHKMSY